MAHVLPRGAPLTYDDLQAMPEDGHRYELIDGTLIVTPAPRVVHQIAVGRLLIELTAGAPDDLIVLVAPVDVVFSQVTVLQPDLLAARRTDFTERNLPGPPLLAVEVLSPSTRRIDLGTKRLAFQDAGVAHYWVVDPDAPSLTAFTLVDGVFGEPVIVTGDDVYDTVAPFPVRVVPAQLIES